MEKWQGKFAVITGASSGLGACMAQKFAENGINVIGLARRDEKVEELARCMDKDSKGKIYARKCDVSCYDSICETFNWIEKEFCEINILVNNAAVIMKGKVLDPSEEATTGIKSMIDTNITGLVNCTRKAVALMKKNNSPSMVINISSISGHRVPNLAHSMNMYPPTKFALRAFNQVARQELMMERNHNIRMSCISPGLVNTPMPSEEFLKNFAHLEAEDIADAALYLLSAPTRVNISDMIIQHPHSI